MAICDHGLEIWVESEEFLVYHNSNEYSYMKLLSSVILFYVLIPEPKSSDIYPTISITLCGIDNRYTIICPNFANMIYVLFISSMGDPGR